MTDLVIDKDLLEEALTLGGLETANETISEALKLFVHRCKVREALELMGTIDYDEDYDYKKARYRG
ncbi:MAG: type II toxin-antitoxin system VapB family antitoxin [Defluviitaleaceae bacterium]|nr:type II toxin-antitoxin system VapB family antitoxin [Defluviitaleaceae bacterium]